MSKSQMKIEFISQDHIVNQAYYVEILKQLREAEA
jgi:hypothetical protein